MSRTTSLILAILVTLIFAGGCGDDDGGVCVPGSKQFCACPGGGTGVQTCNNLDEWWECICDCTPNTCFGIECGSWPDGCGGTINCGGCTNGTCNTWGECVSDNYCGDGTIDFGEECDGANLGPNNCTTVPGGFTGGTLSCYNNCTFNTAGCDDACVNDTWYCIDQSSVMYCDAGEWIELSQSDLIEGCQANNYPETQYATCVNDVVTCCGLCATYGRECGTYGGPGTVCPQSWSCGNCSTGYTCDTNGQCIPDTPPTCGNGNIDPGEVCDGANLGGNNCTTVPGSFTGGTLSCSNCSFDTSSCTFCGDGTCNGNETCTSCSGDCGTCPTTGPDLTPTAFTATTSTTVAPGDTISTNYTRQNLGDTASGIFRDGYYLSTDNTIAVSDTLLSSATRSSMVPGEISGPYLKPLTIPAGTPDGTYWVGYFVDDQNAVAESNEGNNTRSFQITVVTVCIENWSCTSWSPSICPCTNQRTRTCTDANNCGTTADKPSEVQSCNHCGNGSCDCGEECDGANLNGNNCTTIPGSFTGGTLSCSNCTFDTSGCTGVPAGWTCDPAYYDEVADYCDCGCGVLDPDCANATVGSCDYCNGTGSCNSSFCPGTIHPFQNWTCTSCTNVCVENDYQCWTDDSQVRCRLSTVTGCTYWDTPAAQCSVGRYCADDGTTAMPTLGTLCCGDERTVIGGSHTCYGSPLLCYYALCEFVTNQVVPHCYSGNNTISDQHTSIYYIDNLTKFPAGDRDWFYIDVTDDVGPYSLVPVFSVTQIPVGLDIGICVRFECDSGTTSVSCLEGSPSGSDTCCSYNGGTADELVQLSPSCSGGWDDSGRMFIELISSPIDDVSCDYYQLNFRIGSL